MKARPFKLFVLFALGLAFGFLAVAQAESIRGDYLEVRSCDVYTGPCFANGEMGLTGKEAVLVWSVRHGQWDGVTLDGLKVVAVIRTGQTLGDVVHQPRSGPAVLIVDAAANTTQRYALERMARSLAGSLIECVNAVQVAPITAEIGTCNKSGCAEVRAGDLVEIKTRCLGNGDHICGNERAFYPPLTPVERAWPAFTELAAFHGPGLEATWDLTGQRSAFLGTFTR